MKLTNIGFKQVTRCGWSDGRYSIPADATVEVPDALGGRLLERFPGAFVVAEDAAADVPAPTPESVVVSEEPVKPRRRGRRG